jgi:hypothetical protein
MMTKLRALAPFRMAAVSSIYTSKEGRMKEQNKQKAVTH